MVQCVRAFSPEFSEKDEVAFVMPACCQDVDQLWSAVMAQLPGYRPTVGRGRGKRAGRYTARPSQSQQAVTHSWSMGQVAAYR